MEVSSIIFQSISLAIIVLWTVRLARSKGLNPLLWGIGSTLLMALAWVLFEELRRYVVFIGMAPLVFLLLFRSPLFRRRSDNAPAAPVAATHSAHSCPRCAIPDAGGQNYCVHCGWDLSQTYAPAAETDEIITATTATAPAPTPEPAAAVLEITLEDVKAAPATEAAPELSEVAPPEPAISTVTPEPAPVLAQDTEPAQPAQTETAPAAPAPPRRIPTAANLTERGIALFRQGRFQEAVDQFTKAIALDPKYKQAWEQRAEAYGRLGRAERQAADRRQLETI